MPIPIPELTLDKQTPPIDSKQIVAAKSFTSEAGRGRPSRRLTAGEILEITEHINAHLDSELPLCELARIARRSPRQLIRTFSITFGSTPHQYVINQRVARAKELLLGDQLLVQIAADLGFANQSHFSFVFQKLVGYSPGKFRRISRLKMPNFVTRDLTESPFNQKV